MAQLILGVPNMTGPTEADAIVKALNIDGVDHVSTDLAHKQVWVDYRHQDTTQTNIELALSSVGYYAYVIDARGHTAAPR